APGRAYGGGRAGIETATPWAETRATGGGEAPPATIPNPSGRRSSRAIGGQPFRDQSPTPSRDDPIAHAGPIDEPLVARCRRHRQQVRLLLSRRRATTPDPPLPLGERVGERGVNTRSPSPPRGEGWGEGREHQIPLSP